MPKNPDSWIAMDPSYKQLEILPGLDAVQISGINPTQLANDFLASGSVNEAEGWATGFSPAILQSAQTQAHTSLQNYITTNLPNATVGDALGGRKIIQQTVPTLPASMTLGTDLDFVFNPVFVSSGEQPFHYLLPAGSYLAVAVVAGSVSPSQLSAARNQLQATKSILESNNQTQINTLTREQLLGDMFQAGVLGYYAQYITLGSFAGLKQDGHHQLTAGVGSFGYEPNVDTFFGIPRRLTTGGAVMNIPIVNATAQDGTDVAAKRNYSIQLGVLSSTLEHAVPEQMFTSPTNPGEAISAVKALQKASQQGQRIYQITQANQASVFAGIHHDSSTMDEIRSALAVGKTVITHTNAVSVLGWTGAGYVILDPETGAGAWKISGGSNGGYYTLTGLALGLVGGIAAVVASPLIAGLVGAAGILISFINLLTLSDSQNLEFNINRLIGVLSGVALAVILGQFFVITFSPLFILGFIWLALSTLRLVVIELLTDFLAQEFFSKRQVFRVV